MNFKKFRFQAPEPGDTGAGADDRGDNFESNGIEGDEAEIRAAQLQAEKDKVEADAAKLQKDIDDKAKPKVEEKTEEKVEEKTEGDDKDKKDTRVPLSRHKDILAKERSAREAVERKLAQYEKGGEVADLNKVVTAKEDSIIKMEGEYAAFLADGKVKEATELMAKIRRIEREITETKSDAKTQQAVAVATEQTRYDTTLARVEGAYPQLDEDHEDYDEALMKRVLKIHRSNQLDGMTPAAALQDAVKFLLGDPKTAKQKEATEVKARVAEKTPEEIAAERKKAEVEKTAEAIKKTPASTKDTGLDSDKAGGGALDLKQVLKLPQSEFNKLGDAELSRLRGDTL